MIVNIFLLVSFVFTVNAACTDPTYYQVGTKCYFSSAVGSYKTYPGKNGFERYTGFNNWFSKPNELFDRTKCKTCCKVLFVSEYNFQTGQRFTEQDDKDGFIRYTMDIEFDDVSLLREPSAANYQQNILLRPLRPGHDLQYFEFGEYNMYNSYRLPKRVHDIQGGCYLDRTLIIYKNKWGDEDGNGVRNQQFTYVHNYTNLKYYDINLQKELGYYEIMSQKVSWVNQPLHFFLPNSSTSSLLCYGANPVAWTSRKFQNTGNKEFYPLMHEEETVKEQVRAVKEKYPTKTFNELQPGYQILAKTCSGSDVKQMFVPVFA